MTNHDVRIDGDVVHKRFSRTDRDQPAREWAALTLLHERAPGLAPRPIDRQSDPPVVTMSRVAGHPLTDTLTPRLTTHVVAAYARLFAVPVTHGTPERWAAPSSFVASAVRWLAEERDREDLSPRVRQALAAAGRWLDDAPDGLREIHDPVFAQADGKAENLLWDGQHARLVDFEYAGVGDLAFEVADLCEHVSVRLRGLRDPKALVAGFDLTERVTERVEAYRVVLATFWLLVLLPRNPGHHRNPAGSCELQAHHVLGLLGSVQRPR